MMFDIAIEFQINYNEILNKIQDSKLEIMPPTLPKKTNKNCGSAITFYHTRHDKTSYFIALFCRLHTYSYK